jgi:serine protease Do
MLEEVLIMGYPPIPGFDGILISERAHIAGYLKSSVGQVLGQSECYLDRQQYLLISCDGCCQQAGE